MREPMDHVLSSLLATQSGPTRDEIIAAAKLLPADLGLIAAAIGFKAGATPLCGDEFLETLAAAIFRGAHIGYDALCKGEA